MRGCTFDQAAHDLYSEGLALFKRMIETFQPEALIGTWANRVANYTGPMISRALEVKASDADRVHQLANDHNMVTPPVNTVMLVMGLCSAALPPRVGDGDVQKLLDMAEKGERMADLLPAIRKAVDSLKQQLGQSNHERDQLAQAIGEAAVEAGIARAVPMDGPTLLMLAGDMAKCIKRHDEAQS